MDFTQTIMLAALLHDIGKISLREEEGVLCPTKRV